MSDEETDVESRTPTKVSLQRPVEDAAAKEAPPKTQAFWLLIWMIKYVLYICSISFYYRRYINLIYFAMITVTF